MPSIAASSNLAIESALSASDSATARRVSWRQRLWVWYLRRPNHPMKGRFERYLAKLLRLRRVLLPIPGPAIMDLPVGELLTTAIARFGCYEKETVNRVLELLRTSKVFLDVGGHFGQYTLAASAILGPDGLVVTVEPNPHNYLELIGNIRLNARSNVYPVLAAASCTDELLNLEMATKGNTGQTRTTKGLVSDGIIIPAFGLAGLLRRLEVPRVDVVKMDVEGFEPAVLDGLLADGLPFPKHIIFEYLPQSFPAICEVVERLQNKGYTLRQVTGAPLHRNQAPLNDNVWAALEPMPMVRLDTPQRQGTVQ